MLVTLLLVYPHLECLWFKYPFLNCQLAWVFHWKCTKTIIYEAFGDGGGSEDFFLFGNFCFFLVCFLFWLKNGLLLLHSYKRNHYHIWFIFYCKCPFKSIYCDLNIFKNHQVNVPILYNQGKLILLIKKNKITNIDNILMYKCIVLLFKDFFLWHLKPFFPET